jgi:hypothetical protein
MRRQFGEVFDGNAEDPARRWRAAIPVLRSDSELLRDVLEKSAQDLVSLRVQKCLNGEVIDLPAAGLPWFLSIFERVPVSVDFEVAVPHLSPAWW